MAAEQDALMAAARCFRCLTHARQLQIQTYLLAVLAGGSTDPETLAEAAECWCGLSSEVLESIMVYLLCVASGSPSCTPEAIEAVAACYECVSADVLLASQTYSLAVAAGGSTDAGTLSALARCFCGVSTAKLRQIQVDLLQDITGVVGTPAQLGALAAGLRGISQRRREGALADFFLTWSEQESVPEGEAYLTDDQGDYITDDQGNRILIGI